MLRCADGAVAGEGARLSGETLAGWHDGGVGATGVGTAEDGRVGGVKGFCFELELSFFRKAELLLQAEGLLRSVRGTDQRGSR